MANSTGGDSKNTLYCSFCGKSQHEVRKLIAGPTVFICDECVELCMDIIREETKTSAQNSALATAPRPALRARIRAIASCVEMSICSFTASSRAQPPAMSSPPCKTEKIGRFLRQSNTRTSRRLQIFATSL